MSITQYSNSHTLTLDIKKSIAVASQIPTYIQNDTAELLIKLLNNGQPYDYSTADRYVINFKRPDGLMVNGIGTYENGFIKYNLGSSEREIVGSVETSVSLFLGTSRISTRPFMIRVLKDYEEGIPSQEGYSVLQELFIEVDQVKASAETATANANNAASKITEFTYKGDYVSGVAYKQSNVVTYGGVNYLAIQNSTSIIPTDANYWKQVAPSVTNNSQTWVATEGQKTFTITNGSYVVGKGNIQVWVGGVFQTGFTESSETTISFDESIPTGTTVYAKWFEGALSITKGHKTGHEAGGQDELDVTKLKNFKENVTDQFTSVTSQLADIVTNPKKFGAKGDGVTDDRQAIIDCFNFVKTTGGTIEIDKMYAFYSPIVFDTSANAKQVVFKGRSYRNTGFLYKGASGTGAAISIGVKGVGSSGFVGMDNVGVYGEGQAIDGVLVAKGQRYQYFDNFMVRTFDGMGIEVSELWLNSWGAVYILNCSRAIVTDDQFNACSIANLVIENIGTPYNNSKYSTYYIASFSGFASFIKTLSIENSSPDKNLFIKNQITVGAYYDENNNQSNLGAGMRSLTVSGNTPKILSGSIKLGGFNANQADAYVIDLNDSDKAFISFSCILPTLNPNAYQKPIKYSASKNADINVDWKIFGGVGIPSRLENAAFSGNTSQNYSINGVKYVFGMHPDQVGKLLMTKYCLNKPLGRGMYLNSSNRIEGYTETNVSASSVMSSTESPHGNKDVCKYSQNTVASFSISASYVLENDKRYLFTTFNGRKLTTDPLPKMRVLAATQDYTISPSTTDFRGFIQTSLITTLTNAASVTFYPLYCENASGNVYHDMSFIIDLGQFEIDYGVSFDGMTTREIEALIKPYLIADEFKRFYRGTTPTASGNRGETIYSYPPAASGKIGWVCTVTGNPATWKPFGAIDA